MNDFSPALNTYVTTRSHTGSPVRRFYMWRFALILFLFGFMQGPVSDTITIDGTTSRNLLRYVGNANTIVINEGTGGAVNGIYEVLAKLQSNDTQVVINGPCFSACTLLLASPKVTFTENASFYVHSSYDLACKDHLLYFSMSPSTNGEMLLLYLDNTAYWIVENRSFESLDLVMIPKGVIMSDYAFKFRFSEYAPKGVFYETRIKLGRHC